MRTVSISIHKEKEILFSKKNDATLIKIEGSGPMACLFLIGWPGHTE
jgi:hypothetical protein